MLIVDDEAMILEVGAEMLEQLGCQAVTASGGREALEIYAAHKGAFDLVILDMIMPGLSGGSCTGQAAEIMSRGCNGFIQKPFNLEALSQKIHEVLARECGSTGLG
ncbi:MAG: Chemotaxis protein CheY [Deltaproteobacteria bacterium ADurb.Bin510]|nr:MAG: Chemotaxis protein CheY [Deltaproteobacteria bacterium ADurb.Bin510]